MPICVQSMHNNIDIVACCRLFFILLKKMQTPAQHCSSPSLTDRHVCLVMVGGSSLPATMATLKDRHMVGMILDWWFRGGWWSFHWVNLVLVLYNNVFLLLNSGMAGK